MVLNVIKITFSCIRYLNNEWKDIFLVFFSNFFDLLFEMLNRIDCIFVCIRNSLRLSSTLRNWKIEHTMLWRHQNHTTHKRAAMRHETHSEMPKMKRAVGNSILSFHSMSINSNWSIDLLCFICFQVFFCSSSSSSDFSHSIQKNLRKTNWSLS